MYKPQHFVARYPQFDRGTSRRGVWWEKCVYYLWWEFLRRNEDYKATCRRKGRGPLRDLYKDFGNVHSVTFQRWWSVKQRGMRLFAEPHSQYSMAILTAEELHELDETGWDSSALLVVSVPLAFTKRFIVRRMWDILKLHHKRKRGQQELLESRALYPLREKFNIHSLQIALAVYDLAQAQPLLKHWEIAQELKFTTTLDARELNKRGRASPSAVAKKATMSVAVSRKLKQARTLIDGVGRGVFPAG